MIPPRIECPCCGTKFTADDQGQRTCGECRIWEAEPLERDDAPIDFGDTPRTAQDLERSMENYQRVSGAKRRR